MNRKHFKGREFKKKTKRKEKDKCENTGRPHFQYPVQPMFFIYFFFDSRVLYTAGNFFNFFLGVSKKWDLVKGILVEIEL